MWYTLRFRLKFLRFEDFFVRLFFLQRKMDEKPSSGNFKDDRVLAHIAARRRNLQNSSNETRLKNIVSDRGTLPASHTH